MPNKTRYRKKIVFMTCACMVVLILLMFRIAYIMLLQSEYYSKQATDLHQRERVIKASRGKIYDRNGVILADNITVCTVSVIHNQIEDPEQVIAFLCEQLNLSEEYVRKRVEKVSSIEKIKSNVDSDTADLIRNSKLKGIKVDDGYKRYYPYGELASKIMGFTGGDNQGIIGLEVIYDSILQGKNGTILSYTDARGIEQQEFGEERIEAIPGENLVISIDRNIQTFATQLAYQAMEKKQAKSVSIIAMNPKNGEVLAMVNVPEFDLNNPYELPALDCLDEELKNVVETEKEKMNRLNNMWRNGCINDTYEPGSIFKIITATACLEEKLVDLNDHFYCPGFTVVEDRRIRCHKTTGHGSLSFIEAVKNSCNPSFVNLGLRLGSDRFYQYFDQFGLLNKTGIDLPGEASTIMHQPEDIGLVELATISFGQSFQITPIQIITTVSSIINGGKKITPHMAVKTVDANGKTKRIFQYNNHEQICSEESCLIMRDILEKVVSEGGGKKAVVEGFRVGGKTATSETLPRGQGKYISSFIGFAPADDPEIVAIAIITHPKGLYYGGLIAAPVIQQLFENILPYMDITKDQTVENTGELMEQ